jgi:nucleoside diphosphate kinase
MHHCNCIDVTQGLIDYMLSGPVCCMVWEGAGAVKTGRVMLGYVWLVVVTRHIVIL